MRVVIERHRWYRGLGGAHSALLRGGDGRMCCLGFVARACGLEADVLEDTADFTEMVNSGVMGLDDAARHLPLGLLGGSTLHDTIVRTNDEAGDEAARERLIAGLLAQVGIEVEFIP